MPKVHRVKQGESVLLIAQKYGFNKWRTIYDHPDNSEFRRLRPEQDLIYPGDKIIIPDHEPKSYSVSVNAWHTFEVLRPKQVLKIRVKPSDSQDWEGRKADLRVGGRVIESKIDSEGFAVFKLPRLTTRRATLEIYSGNNVEKPSYVVGLKLAHLDPLETAEGVQARLNSLGYECGKVDGNLGEVSTEAIRQFQVDNHLKVDGEAGDKTRTRIKALYGC